MAVLHKALDCLRMRPKHIFLVHSPRYVDRTLATRNVTSIFAAVVMRKCLTTIEALSEHDSWREVAVWRVRCVRVGRMDGTRFSGRVRLAIPPD